MYNSDIGALRQRVAAVVSLAREARYLIRHPAELAREADGVKARKHPKALAHAVNDVVTIVFDDVHLETVAALARARRWAPGAKDDVRQLLQLEHKLADCMIDIR